MTNYAERERTETKTETRISLAAPFETHDRQSLCSVFPTA